MMFELLSNAHKYMFESEANEVSRVRHVELSLDVVNDPIAHEVAL